MEILLFENQTHEINYIKDTLLYLPHFVFPVSIPQLILACNAPQWGKDAREPKHQRAIFYIISINNQCLIFDLRVPTSGSAIEN